MLFLSESIGYNTAKMEVESGDAPEGKQKPLFMKGIFIQGEVKNFNERVYPLIEIRKAVACVNEQLEEGFSVLGELDHPEELTINTDRVSHKIEKMWMEGNNGYGKLKIIDTLPMGAIVRALVEENVKLGVSSRGRGEVDHRGFVSDFEIITVDIVAKPSAPKAYPNIVHEARNMRRGHIIDDLSKAATVDPMARKYLKEELSVLIDKFGLRG